MQLRLGFRTVIGRAQPNQTGGSKFIRVTGLKLMTQLAERDQMDFTDILNKELEAISKKKNCVDEEEVVRKAFFEFVGCVFERGQLTNPILIERFKVLMLEEGLRDPDLEVRLVVLRVWIRESRKALPDGKEDCAEHLEATKVPQAFLKALKATQNYSYVKELYEVSK